MTSRQKTRTDKGAQLEWWMEEYGFFGQFYIQGDDSVEGYLEGKRQALDERTQVEAEGVMRLLQLREGDTLMDCPCGYGRHSIALRERGIDVYGYDLNLVHLSKAMRDAEAKGLNVRFTKQNMIDICDHGCFDAVINMFYSFGFFERDEDNFRVLQNFYEALKPGGRFLMHTDVNMPRVMAGAYKFDEDRTLNSGGQCASSTATTPRPSASTASGSSATTRVRRARSITRCACTAARSSRRCASTRASRRSRSTPTGMASPIPTTPRT